MASRLRRSISEHHCVLHPVRRLSTEILVEIFSFVVAEAPFRPAVSAIDPSALWVCHEVSPLSNLALTCRQWSAVVFGTPRLWSNLDMDVCESHYEDEDMWYHGQVSRHLRNAMLTRNNPLAIRIGRCEPCSYDYDLLPITYVLPICAPNITHLTLFLPPTALDRLKVMKGQLSQLVYAAIVNTAEDGTEGGFVDYDLFTDCTNLRTLHVANFDTVEDICAPRSVEELSLRHYSICQSGEQTRNSSFSSSMSLPYLARLPNMQRIFIDISGQHVPGPGEMVQLPNLVRLDICADYDIGAQGFLDNITTPRLTTLLLAYIRNSPACSPTTLLTALSELVVRSGCFLRGLVLELTAEPAFPVLLRIVGRFHVLEHLVVRTRGPSNMLSCFAALGTPEELPGRTLPIILPKLKTLTLEAHEHDTRMLPMLAKWIEIRKTTAGINRVDIVSRAKPGLRYTDAYRRAIEGFVDGFSDANGAIVRCQFIE